MDTFAAVKPNPFDKKSWIKTGLSWGAFMFLVMSIGLPYFDGEEITWKTLLLGLVIWTIGKLGFGYMMKVFMNKTISKKENTAANNKGPNSCRSWGSH